MTHHAAGRLFFGSDSAGVAAALQDGTGLVTEIQRFLPDFCNIVLRVQIVFYSHCTSDTANVAVTGYGAIVGTAAGFSQCGTVNDLL